MSRSVRGFVVAFVSLALVAPLAAQSRPSPWRPQLGGGRVEWDVDSIKPSTTIVMRTSRYLVLQMVGFEWGAAYAAFDEQDRLDATQTLAIDAQLQVHTPWERVQPFAGAGPSLFMYATNASGRKKFQPGLNASAGLRVQVTPGLALVADVRRRAWDLFDDTLTTGSETKVDEAKEVTLSVAFRR